MDESKCFAGKRWSDVEVLLDCKRVVSLLSPKAIFNLAWGNAPGIGVRFPGAMPLAMVIMAVGQSDFSRGDAPGYGDYGRWPIGVPVTCGQSDFRTTLSSFCVVCLRVAMVSCTLGI